MTPDATFEQRQVVYQALGVEVFVSFADGEQRAEVHCLLDMGAPTELEVRTEGLDALVDEAKASGRSDWDEVDIAALLSAQQRDLRRLPRLRRAIRPR